MQLIFVSVPAHIKLHRNQFQSLTLVFERAIQHLQVVVRAAAQSNVRLRAAIAVGLPARAGGRTTGIPV